jgi:hypothetical protein
MALCTYLDSSGSDLGNSLGNKNNLGQPSALPTPRCGSVLGKSVDQDLTLVSNRFMGIDVC